MTVEAADIANLVYDLHGARTMRGVLNVSASKAVAVLKIVTHRLTQRDFFLHPKDGVAVENGFLAIESGSVALRQHSPDQRQQSRISLPFDPNADTSVCDGFLFETLGDQSLVNLIYEVAGVAVFGYGSRYQVIIIFHGEGANGKSLIVKLIQKLIAPSMRSSVPPSEWGDDYQRFLLAGSRFNAVGELPPFKTKSMEALKGISAGDRITVRRVKETGFEIRPIALHLFSTNQLPPLPETGTAIERRFLVVPFDKVVPLERRIPDFEVELFQRGGLGFLRRTVEGFQRVLKRGRFSRPQSARIATLRWMHGSDPVRVFAEIRLEKVSDPNARIRASDMYKECCSFCAAADLSPPSSLKQLSSRLKQLGYASTKSSTMVWIGVKFRDTP